MASLEAQDVPCRKLVAYLSVLIGDGGGSSGSGDDVEVTAQTMFCNGDDPPEFGRVQKRELFMPPVEHTRWRGP